MSKNSAHTSLANRLNHLLTSININQREFAERIGFTQSYISLILNGSKKTPSSRFYDSVAREFSVNSAWLSSGTGEVYAVPGISLSPPDAEIVARYKLLPPEDQTIVDEVINALLLKTMGGNSRYKN